MTIRLILLLSYIAHGNSNLDRDVVWLESPRITPWGQFGPIELCPRNNFVTGMRLKIDPIHSGDNTALNGVQLMCTTMYGESSENITSAVGKFGEYGEKKYCRNGFATGYQLRSQHGQGNAKDDVAAVDFKLICSSFNTSFARILADDRNKLVTLGHWTQQRNCRPMSAICGIVTQVEDLGNNLRKEDESTLNNVDVACCPIVEPIKICNLRHKWETIIACSVEANCEIKLSTGIVKSERFSKYTKFYKKLGYERDLHEYMMEELQKKADEIVVKINNSSLKYIINNTKIVEEETLLRVNCPGVIEQLVVACDFIKLYTYENRCVPDQYAKKEWRDQSLYFRPTSRLENVFWSYNCDFTGGNVANTTSEIADCGDICLSNPQCTHFVWNKYNGGTCWLKGSTTLGPPVEKYDTMDDNHFICGWIERPQIKVPLKLL